MVLAEHQPTITTVFPHTTSLRGSQGWVGTSVALMISIEAAWDKRTHNELRVKAHNDPEFPSEKTIRSRFGAKPRLISRVIKYFSDQNEFNDVVALCQQYKSPSHVTDENQVPFDDSEFGYVYLAKSGRFYKIGRTNATGRRNTRLGFSFPRSFQPSTSFRPTTRLASKPTGTNDLRRSARRESGSR